MMDESKTKAQLLAELGTLRASEARYRHVFETISDFAYSVRVDPDGTRQPDWVTPVPSRLTGYDPAVMLQPGIWRQLTQPEDWPIVQHQIDELLANRAASAEYRLINADGEVHWVLDQARPIWDAAQQRVTHIYGALQDITERKEAEREHAVHIHFLESLDRIDQAIKHDTDVEQMLEHVIQVVHSIFGCDRAWLVYPCDPDAPSFRVPVEYCRPEYPGANTLNLEVPMVPGMAQEMRNALALPGPIAYSNTTAQPVAPEVTEQFGVQAQLEMALYPKIGQPWVFGLHQCAYPRQWTAAEKNLFNEIGRRLADGLSNLLYLRHVKESEARFRAIFEQAAVGVAQIESTTSRFVQINQKYCDIVGYPREALMQTTFLDITHPDDRSADVAHTRQLLDGDIRTYTLEKRYCRADGSVVWVNLTLSPMWATGEAPSYHIAVVEDISERKQAQHNLELLALAGRELSTTLDLHTIYLTLQRMVKQAMPCDFVFVSRFSAVDQLIRCVYGNGSQGEFDVSEFPPIPLEAEGRGTQSRVIRSGSPLLLNDYQTYLRSADTSYLVTEDGTLQSRETAADDQPRSALIVPLKLEGQVVGVVQVLSERLAAYASRDLQFLESLALHVSTALANAQLLTQVQLELADRKQAEAALLASEQKFRSFIEQAAIGLSLTDEGGRISEWNDALANITGLARANAVGQLSWDVQYRLVPPDQREHYTPEVLRNLRTAFVEQSTAARTVEVTLQHPERGVRIIEDTVFPIVTERGRLIGQLVRDVTEQRRLEDRYRLLFNEMQDGFGLSEIICDEAGVPVDARILEVNPAFERLTGLRAVDVLEHTLREVVPNIRAYWIEAYGQVALTRRPVKLEGPLIEGGRYLHMTAFSPLPGQFALIFQDVTERRQAERQLQLQGAALEAAANGIIITDRTGQIEWANPAFTVLSGYTLDEVIGRNPRDLVRSGKQSREFYREMWAAVLSDLVWRGELINRRKDGRLYMEEITITPVRLNNDELISHFVAIKQDITARKQVDQALRQYAERLQTLHEIDRGVAVAQSPRETARTALQHLRRLMPGDQASVALLDQSAHQLVLLAAISDQPDVVESDARLPLVDPVLEPLRSNQVVLVNDSADDRAAAGLALLAHGVQSYMAAPLMVEDELIGVLTVGTRRANAYDQDHLDIIRELSLQLAIAIHQARLREQIQQHAARLEERVAERTQALAAANARLQDLDLLKSKFVSEVSHELRTPVTSLVLYLDLLEHGKPEKRQHYLTNANVQAKRMKQLIEDILDLSRLDRDKAELVLSPLDLNAVLEQAVIAQLPRAEAAGLHMSVELTPLPAVRGDISRMLQVATNLLANAINYTPAGEVHVRSFRQADRAGFAVQDTGMGIAPEDLSHLFQRFYRGQRASQSSVRGTGLGLSIVKEIVDWHGGQIEVVSEVGAGSTFTVWLPLAG